MILGTFQLEKKKDGRNDVKGDDASGSGSMLPSPSGTESLISFHPGMESSGRNPNDEHHTITSSGMGGGAHFMMQPPQGMHMTHARPSVWGSGPGYDLSGNKSLPLWFMAIGKSIQILFLVWTIMVALLWRCYVVQQD